MIYDLIVVGGGPAGMLGAAAAGEAGRKVLLLEKNPVLGKKLSITGNGRCNVTNIAEPGLFESYIVTNSKFLSGSLSKFNNRRLVELLNGLGVRTKVEEGGRVFPASDNSRDVIVALEKHLNKNRVEIRFKSEVKQLMAVNGRVKGVLLADGSKIEGKNVLIATGGMSYRQSGSTGDGYNMARALGHSIIQPRPALVPLVAEESWIRELQGLALEGVVVSALDQGRVIAREAGEMLFTHYGVSGPAILNLSSYLGKFPVSTLQLSLDLKPSMPLEQLNIHLQDLFSKNTGKMIRNSLAAILPQRLVPVVIAKTGLDGQKQVDRVTRLERDNLARAIKNMIINLKGTRSLNEAIITGGGINVKEINPSTMESKLVKGLYFAGEVMDVDALTGGYNLQIAFSTGYLSGISSAGQ